MESIRAFVAISLPEPLLDRVAQIQRGLEDSVPYRSVRWVRMAGIHLTLKFLGDMSVSKVPQIEQALCSAAQHAPQCNFSVAGLGCFPNLRRPRIIWVGVTETSGRLAALQAAIEEAVNPLGFELEGRGFTPHLTIGRVARRATRTDAVVIGDLIAQTEVGILGEVSADHFSLIQSILKPTGAEYAILRTFALCPPANRRTGIRL